MQRHHTNIRLSYCLLVAVVCACALASLLGFPRPAQARDYAISWVDIDASVDATGALSVTEERTFDFDGDFNGVYWNIPIEDADGTSLGVTVEEAGYYRPNDSYQALAASDTAADGSFSLQEVTSDAGVRCLQLKIYHVVSDTSVTFRIRYRMEGAVHRWADTGELYWKFVSDGWDVPSENVDVQIHLPIPAGERLSAGENVRMWAHGPLTGTIEAAGNDITAHVDEVGTGEYAEVRVLFPEAWLSQMEASGTARRDAIIAEENTWAAEADAQRQQARLAVGAGCAIPLVVAVVTLVVAIRARILYKRSHTPQFSDPYFRDVPSADHPAVLGALFRGEAASPCDLQAALMRLTDLHVFDLEQSTVSKKHLLREKEEAAYTLVYNEDAAAKLSDPVDRATCKLIFKTLWRHAGEERDEQGRPQLAFSALEDIAHDNPKLYSNAIDTWAKSIDDVCCNRSFYVDDQQAGRRAARIMVVVCFCMAGLACVLGFFMESGVVVAAGAAALIVAIAAQKSNEKLEDLSREAIELKAKLKALRAWLLEFTALDEAVPTDVVLWNRLLVMAVALGVAEEVIKQLKVAAPGVLTDPGLTYTYVWYSPAYGAYTPMEAFSDAANSAAHISTAALAESSGSSFGGGGGFSGGGGGGAGGGGGGGAF